MIFASLHRAASRHEVPWRNGGGVTAELLCAPPGAGLDTFGWRLSMARVTEAGPFSAFPGVTRILTVLDGGPMVLTVGAAEHRLDRTSAPLIFDGGVPAAARLDGPAVLDLNLMLRGGWRGAVARVGGAVKDRRPDHSADPLTDPTALRMVLALGPRPELGLDRHDLGVLLPGAAWPAPADGPGSGAGPGGDHLRIGLIPPPR